MIKDYNLSKEWIQAMGIEDLALISNSQKDIIIPRKGIKKEKISQNLNEASESRILADKVNNLQDLRKIIQEFDGCELKKCSQNTVFADGVENAEIMLIGEAPGATEDEKGIPFCGESGRLLDNMLKSINLSRDKNIYITNTIFWRPPANRAPTDEEIEICRPFVEKHIALINPKLLILVGSTAVTTMLGKEFQISKIRQVYYNYTNRYLNKPIVTTAIFHPAYLLRQPMQKKTSWYDLLKIQEYLNK
jgi:uracil-DNA glycosylase family 4